MIWYLTRTIAAEIFNTIRDFVMCKQAGKCQTEKTLAMDCSDRDVEYCEFDRPIPTVAEIEVENLLEQIDNPGMENEALERLCKDVTQDMSYTEERKKDGTY